MRAPQTKALGRMTGHKCKCGAVIICPTRVQQLARKRAEEEKPPRGACVVCFDAVPDAVFVPCGHLVACMTCVTPMRTKIAARSKKLPQCHVCRAPVEEVVRVFTT